MLKRITVFCASSRMIDSKYFKAARQLAEVLTKNNITAVYGGGAVGLMGALADYMLENGGNIIGVIPQFMLKVEWGHPEVKKMMVTKDMHERKQLLIKDADAVVALPGGSGTLEELLEVISLKRLGKFLKPIIIINTAGFYDPLVVLLNKMVEENFMRPDHLKMWKVINHPSELIAAIRRSETWDEDAINTAGV
ncbi:MAG TPA: TIGR00730 family Rossman fold protein [Bacteroidales bacterium]|nr:TIGR00730 family Rossman fold protein [Bacteroidales bacterium]